MTAPSSPRSALAANSQPTAKPHAARLPARLVPVLVCLAAALLCWAACYPGLLSPDSFAQYEQALARRYTDWHPPIMSIVLSGFMAWGGGIGGLTLLQSVAGCLGLYRFALACLRFIFPGDLRDGTARRLALAVFLLILWPLTPFCYYLVTFWKDAWVAILLLWVGATGLDVFMEAKEADGGRFAASFALLNALMALSLLVRHNALVLLPVYAFAAFLILRRRGVRLAPLGLLAPPLLYVSAECAQYRLFHVEEVHPGDQVMALDLVGLCVADERFRSRLPFTDSHLVEERYRHEYMAGNAGPIVADRGAIVKRGYARGNHEKLAAEYRRALASWPLDLLRIKLEAFRRLLHLGGVSAWYQSKIVDNRFGLALNRTFERLRAGMFAVSDRVIRHRRLRWFSGVHMVWLILNAVWVFAALELYVRQRDPRLLFGAVMLLGPLAYYLSYLVATTDLGFRFMYPATVVMQVVSPLWLARWLGARGRQIWARYFARRARPAQAAGE